MKFKPLINRVKVLMQKTHPDKATDYEHEFKQMKQCASWIRSGISLPTPLIGIDCLVTKKATRKICSNFVGNFLNAKNKALLINT
jgi:hypothetical protein